MTSPPTATVIQAAHAAADVAAAVIRPFFRSTLAADTKDDRSPVTIADRSAEQAMRAVLSQRFPDHAIHGEEYGLDRAHARFRWVLDPIDGTRAFVKGDPCWTVALALVRSGRPVAGVVHAPALNETFAAARGAGATLNGAPIRAAQFAALDGVQVGGPRGLRLALAEKAGFRAEAGPPSPSLAYRLVSVAAGRVEIGLSGAGSHDWDIAAADVILEEAGAGLHEDGGQVRYNQASTGHNALVAAPREWLARLGRGA